MTAVAEKRTLTLEELDAIENNVVLQKPETLLQQLDDVNNSDRTVYANSDETFVLAKRHAAVADKLITAIDQRYKELMTR